MWALLTLLVVLAILITALRFVLPQLDQFREPINLYLSKQAEVYIHSESLEGSWAMEGPDLTIRQLSITQPGYEEALLSIDNVDLRIDLWRSLLRLKPVFADVTLSAVDLDLTQIPQLDPSYRVRQRQSSGPALTPQRGNIQYQLEQLFFVQLDQFLIADSHVTLLAPSGDKKRLYVPALKWLNRGDTHLAEGQVSLADTPETVLNIRGNIRKPKIGFALSGTLYADASKLQVTPWLSNWMKDNISLIESEISFETWINIDNGQVDHAQLALEQSHFVWAESDAQQRLDILNGSFYLRPDQDGWAIRSHQLAIDTNGIQWPDLAFRADIEPRAWQVNLAEIEMETLRPLYSLFPVAQPFLEAVNLGGSIDDIRLGWTQEGGFGYSANIADFSMQQWELLPEVHHLNIEIRGDQHSGLARLGLKDDTLPYGDVFQAPLVVTDGNVDLYWGIDSDGWQLWSDSIEVKTPHLKAKGEFRLDFPNDAPAWLSYYAEADVFDAGHTWRYLPTLALGEDLTDYLSGAVLGGSANNARLLWFGDLNDFPYSDQTGIFQVDVDLEDAQYEFYPGWPALAQADINLFFENESLHFSAPRASTLGAEATKIHGVIAELSGSGHLDIALDIQSEGDAVRTYISQSPLESSVGSALDYVQPDGDVTGSLSLYIPFDDRDIGVDGVVNFLGNDVKLAVPALTLTNARGKLLFNQDDIDARNLSALLYGQPVNIDVEGSANTSLDYRVAVDVSAHWMTSQVAAPIDLPLLEHVDGAFPWQGRIEVDIDNEVEYRIDVQSSFDEVNSSLPYPMDWEANKEVPFSMSIAGDSLGLEGRVSLPDLKHQLSVAFDDDGHRLKGSYLGLGSTSWKASPLQTHTIDVKAKSLDVDRWIEIVSDSMNTSSTAGGAAGPSASLPVISRLNVELDSMRLATMDWHQLSIALRRHPSRWHAMVNSREVNGSLDWPDGKPLDIELDEAYLNFSALAKDDDELSHSEPHDVPYQQTPVPPLATERELLVMKYMPNIDLRIGSSWLQGYRIGEVSGRLRKEDDTLLLQQLEVFSGDTYLSMDGHWTLRGNNSESQLVFEVDGANSSDLMGRFSTSGGLENATFNTYASLEWQGAPWQLHRESMNGEIRSRMGKGIIAQVGGAGRLLGLFSLESILRKMQLDFSGVFDDGLPFNYLTGSGQLENGIFTTNDIEMETLAGDLRISGTADLTTEWVEANVRFSPDFTSGLPTLTAFAVAPQSALLVFAVSTILSPVVDVFTQINYYIEGPIDEPVVQERSRSRGEIKLKSKDDE